MVPVEKRATARQGGKTSGRLRRAVSSRFYSANIQPVRAVAASSPISTQNLLS